MANPIIEDGTNQLFLGNHRYDRDLNPKPGTDPQSSITPLEKAQRVAVIALPFLALYKPLGSAISLGMNATRSISCLFQTKKAFSTKGATTKDQTIALFQTAIAAAAVAGSIFGNIYGMVITSGYDALINLYEMLQCIKEGKYEKALEKFLQLAGNALYLTMILHGSLEILIISFVAQILLEAFKSGSLFNKYFKDRKQGKGEILDLLEGFAHLGMAGIRGYQMAPMLQMLQFKWQIEKAVKEHESKQKQMVEQSSQIIDEKPAESTAASNRPVAKAAIAGVAVGTAAVACCALAENSSVTNNISASNKSEINPEILDTLTDYANDPEGLPVLHYAVKQKNIAAINSLIKSGIDINEKDWRYENTALHLAAKMGDIEIVSLLLDLGADVTTRDIFNNSVFHYAVDSGNDRLIPLLRNSVEKECILSIFLSIKGGPKNNYGKTALMKACSEGKLDMTKALVKAGADIGEIVFKDYTMTALHFAIMAGDLEIVKFLLANGPSYESYAKEPLICAAEIGNFAMFNYLLNLSKMPLSKDGRITLLSNALYTDVWDDFVNKQGKIKLVNQLIDWGWMDEHIELKEKFSVEYGVLSPNISHQLGCYSFEMIELLINKNILSIHNPALLRMAVQGRSDANVQLALFLIEKGADIWQLDCYDSNLLHDAVESAVKSGNIKWVELVSLLIEKGLDINQKNRFDQTPLDCAEKNEHTLKTWKEDYLKADDFLKEEKWNFMKKMLATTAAIKLLLRWAVIKKDKIAAVGLEPTTRGL